MQHISVKAMLALMALCLLGFHQGCSLCCAPDRTASKDDSVLANQDQHAEGQPALAEESTDQASETIVKESVPKSPEFLIGPGDQLQIRVYRHDDLSRDVYLGPSGKLMYPLTGDIHAAGLNIFQLRDKIREGLSRYIVDPQVTVRILSIQSQRIIVLGEVNRPGYFPTDISLSAIEAISRAGGFTLDAERKTVLLIRGGMDDPELKVLDLKKALTKGILADNIVLQAGDIMYVPNTAISNVSRFFAHLQTIILPIVTAERVYLLGDEILTGETRSVRTR